MGDQDAVVAVWSGTRPVRRVFAVPVEGLVLGRELLGDTDDDRITVPPSMAHQVVLLDDAHQIAAGDTLHDKDAIACARAWLAGSSLDDVVRAAPFLRVLARS